MDEMIRCSSCGEINSAEQEFCQSCQARIHPLTGSFDGADAPLVSGQIPNKKKNTAELEPILPQWLRDARTQARETLQEEDSVKNLQPPKPASPANLPVVPLDLLAGLQSQNDDENEDETPDWLASITGVSSKAKKTEHEPSDVRWVEVGEKEDFSQDAPFQKFDNKSPDWLNNIQAQPKSDKDELTDWFKETSNPNFQDEPRIDQTKQSASTEDAPDWLRQMQVDDDVKNNNTPFKEAPSSDMNDNATDWLKSLGAEDGVSVGGAVQAEQPLSFGDDLPNWLNSPDLQAQSNSVESVPLTDSTNSENEASLFSIDDAPDWLKNAPAESLKKETPLKKTAPLWLKDDSDGDAVDQNVPAWLSPDAPVINQPPAIEVTSQAGAEFGDIPNWLKAAAPQASVFSEPAIEHEASFSSDAPDWLSSLKSLEPSQSSAPFQGDVNSEENLTAPAFEPASFEAGSDAIFTEMPDWLTSVSETPAVDPVINNADSISAGELPSWVQAMRPVDTGIIQHGSGSLSSDQTLESRGALAGLQGVLPSAPGYAPSSKPKAYSILLRATDEQQSQAGLLEQILAAEAQPQPIASYKLLVASRSLRWFVSLMVFTLLTVVITLRTQIFDMPVVSMDSPNEVKGALDVAQNIPESAPVLVVVDYQPARAAELEAAAAPMLDQMDLLRHPQLFFVSTSETGATLTERLLSLPSLRDRYQGEFQLTNLGYLPGGEMGIRAFMQDPYQTIPVDINRNPTRLQPNISIVQFVAVIILTDSADTSRTWIEQAAIVTYPMPFPAPIVLITSAQAGPMNEPYYLSGQVKGIVSGLYGAAVFEQNNAGRPGTARTYWDAYSLGSLLAMLMLVLGGLSNLVLGARDRSLTRELK